MTATYEYYKILGVNFGAGFADITASYKRLCRAHHPDINKDPKSEELMKDINIAYMALREKFMRDTIAGNKQIHMRPVRARRYSNPDIITTYTPAAQKPNTGSKKTKTEDDIEAFTVIHDYFTAINNCDYDKAYTYLSSYDRTHVSRDCFIRWRQSVARLYPMREFKITGGLIPASIRFKDNTTLTARKFNVAVTEDNYADDSTYEGVIEKLVTYENGSWKVFLGYKSVIELTRRFDERLEAKKKRDLSRLWEEYFTEFCPDYNMYNLPGMKKVISREIYRQHRYGGTISLTVLSVTPGGTGKHGQEELIRCAARTITAALRDTDVPGYAGDGIFMILFVELGKNNSKEVIERIIEKVRRKAGPQLGGRAIIKYETLTWSGENPADPETVNDLLSKFCAKSSKDYF